MYYLSRIFVKMKPVAKKNSVINKAASIGGGTQFINSSIGKYSFCGYDCKIINTSIGAFCSIANNVKIGLAEHPIDWVSTSCAFYKGRDSIKKDMAKLKYEKNVHTEIGNDVWICENVMIKAGVKVSDGAVIGMGSVVTKDVGSYEIWAGNPARYIRKRFEDTLINELLQKKWWSIEKKDMKELGYYMDNPKSFLKEFERREKSL